MTTNIQVKLGTGVKLQDQLNLKSYYVQLSNKDHTFISRVVKAADDKQALFQEDFHFPVQSKDALLFKATLWEYDTMLFNEPTDYVLADHQFDMAMIPQLNATKKNDMNIQLKDKQQAPLIQLSLQIKVLNDEVNLFKSTHTPFMPPQHSSAQPYRRQISSMPANHIAPISTFTTSVPAIPQPSFQSTVRNITTMQKAAASFQQLKTQASFVQKNNLVVQTKGEMRTSRVGIQKQRVQCQTMQSPLHSPVSHHPLMSPQHSSMVSSKIKPVVQSARPLQRTQTFQPSMPVSQFNLSMQSPQSPQAVGPRPIQFSQSTRNIQNAQGFFKRL